MSTMYTTMYMGEKCDQLFGPDKRLHDVTHENRVRFFDGVSSLMMQYGMEKSKVYHGSPLSATWFSGAWYKEWAPPTGSLPGQEARVSVFLDADCLTVTIQDFDNDKETIFLKIIESDIASLILEDFGVSAMFRRQSNILGP